MTFIELLARQRRAEIGIALADDGQGPYRQPCVELLVVRLPKSAGRHIRGPALAIAGYQTVRPGAHSGPAVPRHDPSAGPVRACQTHQLWSPPHGWLDPAALPVLGPPVEQKNLYRLLTGPDGAMSARLLPAKVR